MGRERRKRGRWEEGGREGGRERERGREGEGVRERNGVLYSKLYRNLTGLQRRRWADVQPTEPSSL